MDNRVSIKNYSSLDKYNGVSLLGLIILMLKVSCLPKR